jgi:hypothetical protein
MFFIDILLAMRITPFMIDFTIIVGDSADKILRNRKEKCPDKTGIPVRLIPETMSNKNRNAWGADKNLDLINKLGRFQICNVIQMSKS